MWPRQNSHRERDPILNDELRTVGTTPSKEDDADRAGVLAQDIVIAAVTGATSGNDLRNGTSAADTIDGLAGNDTLNGLDGNDTLLGATGNDVMRGGSGADSVSGASGCDRLSGGTGADTLKGDRGDDRLAGDADDDALIGGVGDDSLDGRPGEDTPVFAGKIGDFEITTCDINGDGSGTVAFFADVNEGGTVSSRGIFSGNGGPIKPLVTGSDFDPISFPNPAAPAINNRGAVGFFAEEFFVQPDVTFVSRTGIFTGPDPIADAVIVLGDPLLAGHVEFVLRFSPLGGHIVPAMNDGGSDRVRRLSR